MWHLSKFWQYFIRKSLSLQHNGWGTGWEGKCPVKSLRGWTQTGGHKFSRLTCRSCWNAFSHMTTTQAVILPLVQAWNPRTRLFKRCRSWRALTDTACMLSQYECHASDNNVTGAEHDSVGSEIKCLLMVYIFLFIYIFPLQLPFKKSRERNRRMKTHEDVEWVLIKMCKSSKPQFENTVGV